MTFGVEFVVCDMCGTSDPRNSQYVDILVKADNGYVGLHLDSGSSWTFTCADPQSLDLIRTARRLDGPVVPDPCKRGEMKSCITLVVFACMHRLLPHIDCSSL
jgi:hypothetical protein